MNPSFRSAALPIAVSLLALPGSSRTLQAPPVDPLDAQGKFSAYPLGLTVSGVSTPDPLLIRASGVANGVPTAWTAGNFTVASQDHPDFSFAALTAWKPNSTLPSFGGVSTGGEIIPPVNSTGQLQMVDENWFMLAISVAPDSVGKVGGIINLQRQGGSRDVSGDIFSYYAIGSEGINSALVGKAFVESTREQLKLQDVPTQSSTARAVTNLDYGMGVIATDALNRAGSMFPVRDTFYFTLTKNYLGTFPQSAPLSLGGAVANSATIYVMTWQMTSPPSWTAPQIALSNTALFPGVDPIGLEIDALTVDRGHQTPANTPVRAIFSLTRATSGGRNQILVYQPASPVLCPTTALMTDPTFGTSKTFSERLGMYEPVGSETGQPDDATATCGGDPRDLNVVGPVVALATDDPRLGAGTLGMSGARHCKHAFNSNPSTNSPDTLRLQVTGMDYEPGDWGFIQLYIEQPPQSGHGPFPAPMTWGDPIWIDSNMAKTNMLELSVEIPCAVSPNTFRFSAKCFAVNFSPVFSYYQLRESWVLSIKK